MLVGTEKSLNIGDYIQAIAAEQFFKHIDVYIERERLDEYNGEPVKMIMNGWYMHDPKHWPPSSQIIPLFVAFHVNSLVRNNFLSPESLDYLKRYQPIGCRDVDTVELLQNKGLNAYFSGCLTLTLGYKYHSKEKNNKCYFVDPFYILHHNQIKIVFQNIVELVFYYRKIRIISRKMKQIRKFKDLLALVSFYREYKKIFGEELLLNAEYIRHEDLDFHKLYPTDISKLDYAKGLVNKYSQAALVVTSRIHCALPCLGIGTPVIYVENKQQVEASSCRLNGLREFFNIVEWDKDHLVKKFSFDGLITAKSHPQNKKNYLEYATALIERCDLFCKND